MKTGAAKGLPKTLVIRKSYVGLRLKLNPLTTINVWRNIMNMIDNAFAISNSTCLPVFIFSFENNSNMITV